MNAPRIVTCPACKRGTEYNSSNRWRPFCSERCRSQDLGAWASESYRVPAQAPVDSADEAPAADLH